MDNVHTTIIVLFDLNYITCVLVPPPNLGDVRLYESEIDRSKNPVAISGKVQVYFTDGGLSPPSWSYLCPDTFQISEAKVLCKQMGYSNGNHYYDRPSNIR